MRVALVVIALAGCVTAGGSSRLVASPDGDPGLAASATGGIGYGNGDTAVYVVGEVGGIAADHAAGFMVGGGATVVHAASDVTWALGLRSGGVIGARAEPRFAGSIELLPHARRIAAPISGCCDDYSGKGGLHLYDTVPMTHVSGLGVIAGVDRIGDGWLMSLGLAYEYYALLD